MIEVLIFAAGGVSALVVAWVVEPLVGGFLEGLRGESDTHIAAE